MSEEDARALPPAVRELFQNRFPFRNYREECRVAGFRDIRDEVIGRFSTAMTAVRWQIWPGTRRGAFYTQYPPMHQIGGIMERLTERTEHGYRLTPTAAGGSGRLGRWEDARLPELPSEKRRSWRS
ncbi:MAG: hypothetical protein ACLRXC_12700 [[Clostridium] leptum]